LKLELNENKPLTNLELTNCSFVHADSKTNAGGVAKQMQVEWQNKCRWSGDVCLKFPQI